MSPSRGVQLELLHYHIRSANNLIRCQKEKDGQKSQYLCILSHISVPRSMSFLQPL